MLTGRGLRSLTSSRMELADQEAVERALRGDGDAFRGLVEKHGRPLFRLAFRMTGNEADAEDVVQESFLRAYRQLGKFDARASFGTWLYRIATNCALDLVRARNRRGELKAPAGEGTPDPLLEAPSGDAPPDRLAMSGQVRERVADAMDELTSTERAAFVLRHFEGMCLEDIGRTMGCPTGAAKHSVFRAVQKLRRALEPLVSTAR